MTIGLIIFTICLSLGTAFAIVSLYEEVNPKWALFYLIVTLASFCSVLSQIDRDESPKASTREQRIEVLENSVFSIEEYLQELTKELEE